MIRVVCKYGAGDFAASPYSHVLIVTEADAVQKGFRILDGTYIISRRYRTQPFPYPTGGKAIRAACWITADFPVAGLTGVPAWVNSFTKEKRPDGVFLSLEFSIFQRTAANISPSLGTYYELESGGAYWELEG